MGKREAIPDVELPDDFEEWATKIASREHRKRCSVCKIPPELQAVIVEGRKRGLPYSAIGEYLFAKGHRFVGSTLALHLKRCVGGNQDAE